MSVRLFSTCVDVYSTVLDLYMYFPNKANELYLKNWDMCMDTASFWESFDLHRHVAVILSNKFHKEVPGVGKLSVERCHVTPACFQMGKNSLLVQYFFW